MKNLIIIFAIFLLGCSDTDSNKADSTVDKILLADNSADFGKSKDSLISQLPEMKSDSLDCNADIYWRIIRRGKASIPLLIENLTDTTMTNIYDHCKKGKLNIAEVSYFALEELAEFPAFVVTQIQFDVIDEHGCWSFFDYFFDNKNKKAYQKKVKDFYNSNKYVFVKFDTKDLNDCRKKYKIDGKLKWKE
jgi:hypothetical protein